MKSDAPAPLVLCVGPSGYPRTGQAMATDTWVAGTRMEILSINSNLERLSRCWRMLQGLRVPVQVFGLARRARPAVMYLSLKRSLVGGLLDLCCVVAYRCAAAGPVIVHLHGAELREKMETVAGKILFRALWRHVTDVILLTSRMSEQLIHLPERRTHVIENCSAMSLSRHQVIEKATHLHRAPLRVLYLSNIIFSKGVLHLAEAVRHLRADGFQVALTLAGAPIADPEMGAEEVFRRLQANLEDGIRYVGAVDDIQKRSLLASAHVIALPTFYRTEAQPICLIEGMAFGCIPLTSRHNYNEDFLDDSIAVFVEPKSPESIAKALQQLIDDPVSAADRMLRASDHAALKHGSARFVEAIDHVIENALAN